MKRGMGKPRPRFGSRENDVIGWRLSQWLWRGSHIDGATKRYVVVRLIVQRLSLFSGYKLKKGRINKIDKSGSQKKLERKYELYAWKEVELSRGYS